MSVTKIARTIFNAACGRLEKVSVVTPLGKSEILSELQKIDGVTEAKVLYKGHKKTVRGKFLVMEAWDRIKNQREDNRISGAHTCYRGKYSDAHYLDLTVFGEKNERVATGYLSYVVKRK